MTASSSSSSSSSSRPASARPASAFATATGAAIVVDEPYGAWESPITSRAITAGSVRLGPVYYADGDVYWLEGRPLEGGRNVLCRLLATGGGGAVGEASAAVDSTPPGSNVRTRVHEYGGGAVVLGSNPGEVYYSEFADQRLCRVDGATSPTSTPITPDGGGEGRYRFADGVVSKDGKTMYCVREDHDNPDPKFVVNEVASIDLADGSMAVIATGNDFYSSPRLSPDGKKLAYVTWDHPNMPWDATELRVASLVADPHSAASDGHDLVAGGDGDTSVIQPAWHPMTGELFYISDASGYYNIYREAVDVPVLPMPYDFGGSAPGWSLGQQGYAFLDDGRLVAQYVKDGVSVLVVADLVVGEKVEVREHSSGGEKGGDGLPAMFGGIVPGKGGELYFLGGGPGVPSCVYRWDLDDPTSPAQIIAKSSNVTFSDDVISVPRQVEFPTTLGTAYGYYYPPKNGGYVCTTDAAPPLLVKAHGEFCTRLLLRKRARFFRRFIICQS